MLRRALLSLVLMAPAAACDTNAPQGPGSADLVIANATIVDVGSGELVPGRTIFVDDGRIVGIVDASRAASPDGARVVDATGRYVMPGLWDAHVHSAAGTGWHFPLLVAHGVTSVRNLHSTVDTALELTSAIKRRVAAGELLGPRFLANGPIIDGYPVSWPGAIAAQTAAEGRAAVDSLAAAGADFIKVYDNLLPEVYDAIMAAAAERGIPVDGHVPFLVTAEHAAASGQRTVEHLTGMNLACSTRAAALRSEFEVLLERLPSLRFPESTVAFFTLVREASESRDPALCAGTVQAYLDAGVTVVPTLVIGAVDAGGLIADSARMRLLPAGVRGAWTGMAAGGPGPIDAVFAGSDWTAPADARLLHEAGVPILAGTDIGNPFLIPGLSLHEELGLLVGEAGLSPLDALRTATINPARTFGLADSLGTVAEGKLADLVLLEANPLEDIGNAAAIDAVVMDGRYLDRGALDELLAEAAAAEN